jgi:DNA-binding transcriptional regulator YiaG
MNVVVGDFRHQVMPQGTSGNGALQWARDLVIRVSGALSVQGTSSAAENQTQWVGEITALERTNSGFAAVADTIDPGAAIAELRRRSGLTWEQLARLFDVDRRSVHFWASGKPMNAANEERLGRLLAVVRHIDRDNARATRAIIVSALPDGVIPFDLLVMGAFDEVMERIGAGLQSHMPTLTPLSAAARAARIPSSPDERVGALQDTVHHEVGRSRTARAVRTSSKR